jgi:hypothetical protein
MAKTQFSIKLIPTRFTGHFGRVGRVAAHYECTFHLGYVFTLMGSGIESKPFTQT